jgi:hypothetical protein
MFHVEHRRVAFAGCGALRLHRQPGSPAWRRPEGWRVGAVRNAPVMARPGCCCRRPARYGCWPAEGGGWCPRGDGPRGRTLATNGRPLLGTQVPRFHVEHPAIGRWRERWASACAETRPNSRNTTAAGGIAGAASPCAWRRSTGPSRERPGASRATLPPTLKSQPEQGCVILSSPANPGPAIPKTR